jgi:hypothetical protein
VREANTTRASHTQHIIWATDLHSLDREAEFAKTLENLAIISPIQMLLVVGSLSPTELKSSTSTSATSFSPNHFAPSTLILTSHFTLDSIRGQSPGIEEGAAMSPPVVTHHLSDLESQINTLPNGKARKPPVNLLECPLRELVQYKCNVSVPKHKGEEVTIVCEPVVRLLRQ